MANLKRSFISIIGVIALALLLVACGNSNSNDKKKDKLNVKTTIYPLTSLVEQIGGEHVEVESVYPEGADLHTYDPSQKDILDVNKSDLFVYTGDTLDPVAKKIAKSIKEEDKKLSIEKGLSKDMLMEGHHHHHGEEGHDHGHHEDALKEDEHEHGEEGHKEEEHEHGHDEGHHGHSHGQYDPHIWLDPVIAQSMAKEVKDELVKKDPDNKADYEKNFKKVDKDLKALDEDLKAKTKDHKGETVFISHDSIGYLAKRYGFKQQGIQSMNKEDPTQKDLVKIVKEINDSDAKYVLYEENISTKITDVIRKDTDAKPLKFNNMEAITKKQSKDQTYQSFMKENVKNLSKALENK
ncbi:metal ABC transporter solute-binding protein, Zn/Mn family [Staphylococcus massiliensis]|uniref:metal ABC transporter solute-binding protein, Zn/Mn family n=1 Tax=Staphylococcus massiliensis TaxID=555791 RepID=UPI003082E72A